MTKSSKISYRRYDIRTLKTDSGYQARAFRGRAAVGEIQSAQAADDAVIAAKAALDERARLLRLKRGPSGYPCADEIRLALPHIVKTARQEAMLQAHLKAPEHTLTATQLANAADYDDYSVANLQYGLFARRLAEELEWTPTESHNGETIWTFAIADDADKLERAAGEEISGEWRWRLRPEVVEALTK